MPEAFRPRIPPGDWLRRRHGAAPSIGMEPRAQMAAAKTLAALSAEQLDALQAFRTVCGFATPYLPTRRAGGAEPEQLIQGR